MNSVSYDNTVDVAAILFALGATGVGGLDMSAEDHKRLANYLGEAGMRYAIALHAPLISEANTPQESLPAPRAPSPPSSAAPVLSTPCPDILSQSQPLFSNDHPSAADLEPPFLSPLLPSHPVLTPKSHRIPQASEAPAAMTEQPSTTVGAKRKASTEPLDDPARVKRRRGRAPTPVGSATCQWAGCGGTIPLVEWKEHMRNVHLPNAKTTRKPNAASEERLPCLWAGCKQAEKDPVNNGLLKGVAGILKHVRDVHFQAKHVVCPFDGCDMRGRDDSIRRHQETCDRNPARRRAMDKENTSE
ncbi:hypothetical protein BD414DRAFT_192305 [Trametes punicea]|nr:hypothetical protein BD414DRAFT_192305 [Trametes punicea]